MRFIENPIPSPKPRAKSHCHHRHFCQECGSLANIDNWCHRCRPLKRYEESSPNDDAAGIGNHYFEEAVKKNRRNHAL